MSRLQLSDLVDAARQSTARRKANVAETTLRRDAEALGKRQGGPGRFRTALEAPGIGVIAEIKGASPLSGTLRDPFDPSELAACYVDGGAAAISVLTEERFFGGSMEHLQAVSASIELPTLRKDFVVELYQVFEAANAGASAVLLIAELLDGGSLIEFVEAAHTVGLDALVEFHRPELLAPAAMAGSGVVGINNRNLDTMEIDFAHAIDLAGQLPADIVTVAESAIGGADDVERVAEAGFDAILVGTALVTAAQPESALRALVEAGAAAGSDAAGDGAPGGSDTEFPFEGAHLL